MSQAIQAGGVPIRTRLLPYHLRFLYNQVQVAGLPVQDYLRGDRANIGIGMIVGETITLQHTETAALDPFILDGAAVICTILTPDGISQVVPVSASPGTSSSLTQTLYALFTPMTGGVHRVFWQVPFGNNVYTRKETFWAYYTDVYDLVRRRLQNDFTIIPDKEIDPEFASLTRKITDTYTGMATAGGYGGLTGDDQYRMDEAIGILVAAKLHAFKPARQATGDITGVKIGQQIDYKFQVPKGIRQMTLEEQWIEEATELLGRVSAIQAQLAAAAAAFNIFTVTGPLRQRYDRGIRDTLVTQLVTLLNDNTFWGWT